MERKIQLEAEVRRKKYEAQYKLVINDNFIRKICKLLQEDDYYEEILKDASIEDIVKMLNRNLEPLSLIAIKRN